MGSQDLGGGPSCVTFIVKTNQPKLKPKPKQKNKYVSNWLIWHSFTSGSKTSECTRYISEVYEDIDSRVHPVGKGHLSLFWQMHQENLWDISLGVNKPWISCPQRPHSYLFGFPVHAWRAMSAGVKHTHAPWSAMGGASEVKHQAIVCRNVFLAGSMTALWSM